jgi:spermidine synthase
MIRLNEDSLNNDKVTIVIKDAFKYILDIEKKYDLIVADFPDPRDV